MEAGTQQSPEAIWQERKAQAKRIAELEASRKKVVNQKRELQWRLVHENKHNTETLNAFREIVEDILIDTNPQKVSELTERAEAAEGSIELLEKLVEASGEVANQLAGELNMAEAQLAVLVGALQNALDTMERAEILHDPVVDEALSNLPARATELVAERDWYKERVEGLEADFRELAAMEGEDGMTDLEFAERALQLANKAALAPEPEREERRDSKGLPPRQAGRRVNQEPRRKESTP